MIYDENISQNDQCVNMKINTSLILYDFIDEKK